MDVVPSQSIPGTSPCLTQIEGHWGWLRVSQAAGTTIFSSPWGWQVLDAELQMSHQLHQGKPELIAPRFECPLLRSGMTERPPDAPRAQLPTAVPCWEAARKSRQTVVLGARGRALKSYK